MQQPTRMQFVLLEAAAAAGAIGVAAGGGWLAGGLAVGVVLAGLGAMPVQRRWLYQLVLSWFGLRRRRRRLRHGGPRAVLGEHRVVAVAGGGGGGRLGAVHAGTLWTLPLEIALDGVVNEDPPLPLDQLVALLRVEDVPLADVRLITLVAPSARPPQAPAGPVAPAGQFAARYCLLTLDVVTAAEAVAARGGSEAAVHQILRRCALRAEQILSSSGVTVRRLDERAVGALFDALLGPSATSPDGSSAPAPSIEGWRNVSVAGTWSTTFAIGTSGTGGADGRTPGQPDVTDGLSRLAGSAATPIAVTTLLVRRQGPRDAASVTALLRLSGAGTEPDAAALARVRDYARALGLVLQRLDGEQGVLLRATTPVGLSGVA